jgi:hypothetical protein
MLADAISERLIQQRTDVTTNHGLMTDLQEDIALVKRIAAEDEAALQEIYALYGQRLYAYALRLTSDHAHAEDVVQDAMVTVWRSAKKFRGEGRLLAWLLGIVHHIAIKSLRRRSTPISEEMEASMHAAAPLPEEQIQASEQVHWVRQGLQELSPDGLSLGPGLAALIMDRNQQRDRHRLHLVDRTIHTL